MRAADSRPRRVLRDALNCENGKSAAPVAGFDAIEARRKSPKPPDTKVKERRIAICRRTLEPAKPSQQVIIYRLRPLLLSPVTAAWKQVKPP